MLTSAGRLVHIDYGFLLGHAPGGGWVAFEAAPMKLPREVLEIMDSGADGAPSELFDLFKARLKKPNCKCRGMGNTVTALGMGQCFVRVPGRPITRVHAIIIHALARALTCPFTLSCIIVRC